MGENVKKAIMSLALAVCLLALSAEIQAGSLISAQVSSDKAAQSDTASALGSKQYTGGRITVDFNQAESPEIVKFFAEISGKNIVFSDSAAAASSEKITLKFKDIPWEQALDMALATKNLVAEESGNVLTIYDADELRKIQSGRKLAGGDNLPRPILIEVRFVEATSSVVAALGIDRAVGHSKSGLDKAGVVFGALKKAGSLVLNTEIHGGEGENAHTIVAPRLLAPNDQEVALTLRPFEIFGSSDKPAGDASSSIALMDQDASIIVVKPVLYISGSSADFPPNNWWRPGKQYLTNMKIRPHIETNEQDISLEIKLINDSPSYPDLGHAEAETRLMVKDRETVAIGGIVLENQLESENRISGLPGVPLSDWMLYSRPNEDPRPELLIFITAIILPLNT